MKKTIVFDIGGVLIDWNPRYLYQKIFSDPEEMEFFLREICSPEWNAQADAGKSYQDAIDELIPQYPDYEEPIRLFYQRWEEMIGGTFPQVIKILDDLRAAGYPLAALSNWPAETFPIVQAKYEFLDWFNPLLISGRIGYKKPQPEFYSLMLCAVDRDPSECIFIDDTLENISAADQLGITSIHFHTAKQLAEELTRMGVL
jgi:2-haloacid dehalogenase